MKKIRLLFDVNVWFAMTFDAHVHHASAKAYFDAVTDARIFFCRVTQHGLLRIKSEAGRSRCIDPHGSMAKVP